MPVRWKLEMRGSLSQRSRREKDKGEHGVLPHHWTTLGQVVIREKAMYDPCFSKLKSPWIPCNKYDILLPHFRLSE